MNAISLNILLCSLLLISSNAGLIAFLTPLCPQRHLLHLGSTLPQVAHLDWHLGALLLRGQLGHQLGYVLARFARLHLAHLLGHVDQGVDLLVVALLRPLLSHTASSTDLHRKLLTGGVPHKLARALLDVPES